MTDDELTKSFIDPEPWQSVLYPLARRAENKYGGWGLQYKPRSLKQYEADQKELQTGQEPSDG